MIANSPSDRNKIPPPWASVPCSVLPIAQEFLFYSSFNECYPCYDRQTINTRAVHRHRFAMEPWDYCQRWVKHIKYGEHGYRAECVRELVRATNGQYKFETINRTWGARFEKRPESVSKMLLTQHIFKTLHLHLSEMKESVQKMDGSIAELLALLNENIH